MNYKQLQNNLPSFAAKASLVLLTKKNKRQTWLMSRPAQGPTQPPIKWVLWGKAGGA
jgi:hypothetical protein